jgi:cysteine-rich repeat protein
MSAFSRARWFPVAVAACTLGIPAGDAAAQSGQQRMLAGMGAVKIAVRGAGWVRVGQPALLAAGLGAGADPARLQLFADGVEQSIVVTGNGDGAFTSNEAIEFYGVGRDSYWSDTRTYWLIVGQAGARVAQAAPPHGAPGPANFTFTSRLVQRALYLATIRNGDQSNFFGATVGPGATAMQTVAVRHFDTGPGAQAMLRVSLQGVTATDHLVDVSLGGTVLGTCTLGPQELATFTFPAAAVAEGNNTFGLIARGSASDYSVVKSVEVIYPHSFTADDDTLALAAPSGTHLSIGGFSSPDIRVVDVTDPVHPVALMASVTTQGSVSTATFDTPSAGASRALYAFAGGRVLAAASVTADAPSTWGDSHDGELVILSHVRFLDAVAPLAARRAQEGWSVQVIDVQDLYDEYSGGDKDAAAIRAFLQDARARWRQPPGFAMLVGDASFDPRNFLNQGDYDFVPTKLIDTAPMETASDDWFADADLDGVPEIAVGRLPVRTVAETQTIVGKLLGYAGAADIGRGGLFVTDRNGTGELDFESASALGESKVSDIMPVERFSRAMAGADAAGLRAELADGPFLVNYLGHGSVEVWDGLLDSDSALTLANPNPSIYVVMNCLNGFFHDLYTESLAEALIKAPGGAIAVWASSTLAEYAPQPGLNQEFLARVTRTSLGEAAVTAKRSITDLETRRTWILFGDPTLFGRPLPPPDGGVPTSDGGMPPFDGGMPPSDGGGSDGGVEAGAMPGDGGGADAGVSPDAGSPDAGSESDAGAPVDAGATVDAGSGSDVQPMADAGGAIEAGTGFDASGGDADKPPSSGGGCDCQIGGTSNPSGFVVFGLMGLLAAGRRNRVQRGRRRLSRWSLGILALGVAWLAAAPAAQAAYGYRRTITIDRTRIGDTGAPTTLTNYPLLISVTSTSLRTVANGGRVENANGYDIAFTGADTTTCGGPATCTFNYEIESYSATTGAVVAWVNIPALRTVSATSDTVIYVQYGDAAISSPTQNANGTWETNFRGVWHMNQNPGGAAPQMSDSTSTAAHATATNGPTTATGLMSSAVTLDGTNDYIDYTTNAAFNWSAADTFTYSAWFRTTDSNGPIISQRGSVNGNPVIDIHIGYDGATSNPGKVMVLVRDDASGGGFAEVVGASNCNDNNWHLMTVTRTGGTVQLYVDGVSQGSNTGAGAASTITTNLRNIGRDGNWIISAYGTADQQYLAGTIDEVRISRTIRSIDWIKTDYNTQSTPASTFSLGNEALASCGNGTKIVAEACDDGNIVGGDGCSATCTIESGYSCVGTMPSVCNTTCGDGIKAGAEACDDGNGTSGDGCTACVVDAAYNCTGTAPSVCTFARFDYYKTITIDRTRVGTASSPTTLSSYPMLFSVTDTSLRTIANGGRVRNANGHDIIFRGVDTTTCGGPFACTMAHEIESYSPTTGALVAWVNIPTLRARTNTSNTVIRIMFGNMAISTSTQQVSSTWNSSFKGVWHLNQNPGGAAPQMSDATSNNNDGTANSLTAVAGRMSNGISTNGSTSYMSFNSGTSLNSNAGGAFTYSTWIRVPVAETLGAILSSRNSASDGVDIDLMVGMDGATTMAGRLMVLVRDDNNGPFAEIVSPNAINDNNWHYVTLTRNAGAIQLYMDTTSQGTDTDAGAAGAFTTNLREIGREGRWIQDNYTTPTTNAYLQATYDEVRYSDSVRSIDWITTDYNNQNTPATFYTYTTGAGGEVVANSTTNAHLTELGVTATCQGNVIRWRTAFETDTLGFNVVREMGGARTALNGALIPGGGLSGGGSRDYQIADPGLAGGAATYFIEEVHFNLSSDWFGPLRPSETPACGPGDRPTPVPVGTSGPSGASPDRDPGFDDGMGGCSFAGQASENALRLVGWLLVLAVGYARRRRRAGAGA